MDWKRLRLILIPTMFGAMAAVAGLHKSGILESPEETVQVFVYIATGCLYSSFYLIQPIIPSKAKGRLAPIAVICVK